MDVLFECVGCSDLDADSELRAVPPLFECLQAGRASAPALLDSLLHRANFKPTLWTGGCRRLEAIDFGWSGMGWAQGLIISEANL